MKWQDHLINFRARQAMPPEPRKPTFAVRVPPSRMELRMTKEQEERCELVEITNGKFHVPCPVPVDPVEIFGEFLAAAMTPAWYNPETWVRGPGEQSPATRVRNAKERYRRELAAE